MAVRQFAQVSACVGAVALASLAIGCGSVTSGGRAVDTRLVTRIESATPAPDGAGLEASGTTPARRERALRLAVAKLRVALARVEGRHFVTSARARALSNRLDSVTHGLDMLELDTESRNNRLNDSLGRAGARVGVAPTE